MSDDREVLIERCVGAHRERDLSGRIASEPAHTDLDEAGRIEAFEQTLRQRALEQALDPDGLTTTARAVLARIRGG